MANSPRKPSGRLHQFDSSIAGTQFLPGTTRNDQDTTDNLAGLYFHLTCSEPSSSLLLENYVKEL